MLIFCANLTFMLPQLSIHQHVTGALVREMFRNVKLSNCRLRSPVPWTNSPTLAKPTVTLQQEHLSLPTRLRLFTQALLEDASTAQVSIPPAYHSSFLLTVGSYRVLNSWKRAWKLPSNFPNLEKDCNIDISSGKIVFVCLFGFFFHSYSKCLTSEFFSLVKSFSISLVCLQRTMKALFLRFSRSLLITYLITLSLGKNHCFGKKSQGKVEFWIQKPVLSLLTEQTVSVISIQRPLSTHTKWGRLFS